MYIPGLLLATYCVLHPHVMSFLRDKIIFFCKNLQNHLERCSVPNALHFKNLESKFYYCALLLNFLALFCYTACMWYTHEYSFSVYLCKIYTVKVWMILVKILSFFPVISCVGKIERISFISYKILIRKGQER